MPKKSGGFHVKSTSKMEHEYAKKKHRKPSRKRSHKK
jgi:hypothetical protein